MSNQAASVESIARKLRALYKVHLRSAWEMGEKEIMAEVTRLAEQGAAPQAVQAATKSLNAMAADLLRHYLKPGQKVIWREAFRWHDDNGVLPNHYEGQEIEVLSDNFGYGWAYDTNLKHAAIVWDRAAATQPQQAKESGNA